VAEIEEKSLGRRFLENLVEFFTPRDWIPTFPIVRKRDPGAQGYQSLEDAIKGFPPKDDQR
jgi:hypothetical protein